MDALREAVDEGWRFWHNFHLDDPALRPLQSDPEFIELREEIEADMAAQYEFLKEIERNERIGPKGPPTVPFDPRRSGFTVRTT